MKGVLVVGSVAAGTAHDGSDIDAIVFLSPIFKRLDWQIWSNTSHEWPEPMRAELGNAWIAFDRTGEIERVVTERTRYDS